MRPLNEEQVAELKAIADRHQGNITAEQVLEAAKNRGSSLHGRFEWDDGQAAYLYRIIQAREVIRSWHVTVEGVEIRAVMSPVEVRPGYVPTTKIGPRSLIAMLLEDLDGLLKRHAHLKLTRPGVYRVVELARAAVARHLQAKKAA